MRRRRESLLGCWKIKDIKTLRLCGKIKMGKTFTKQFAAICQKIRKDAQTTKTRGLQKVLGSVPTFPLTAASGAA
jgi:hypothetical protein